MTSELGLDVSVQVSVVPWPKFPLFLLMGLFSASSVLGSVKEISDFVMR